MEQHALILSVLILVIDYTTSSSVHTPEASLQEHVKKLDEMLAEMQSHSQAQEQKYSAVLSSLLSQLTQTTDELEDLKTSYNETLLTSDKRDAELSELWASHNETVRKVEQKDAQFSKLSETVVKLESTIMKCKGNDAEISKLWASHNETVLKLESTNLKLKEKDEELSALLASQNKIVSEFETSNLNLEEKEFSKLWESQNATVVDLEKTKYDLNHNGYIGFQGRLSEDENATANTPIHFDYIFYNAGACYDNNTGIFTTPLKGTYLIWIDLTYKKPENPLVFMIYRNSGYAVGQAFGIRSSPQETASTTTMAYLHKGDYIWVAPSVNVSMDHYFCSFGIVLLNAFE